ncbi:hypothetical protein [Helicobacter pylori]|nr:hypothetical protein [Helicobacter pylori]MBH0290726.1 hypothetical protein [Helicobacter pylori]
MTFLSLALSLALLVMLFVCKSSTAIHSNCFESSLVIWLEKQAKEWLKL